VRVIPAFVEFAPSGVAGVLLLVFDAGVSAAGLAVGTTVLQPTRMKAMMEAMMEAIITRDTNAKRCFKGRCLLIAKGVFYLALIVWQEGRSVQAAISAIIKPNRKTQCPS
jgi:hypothetical protein